MKREMLRLACGKLLLVELVVVRCGGVACFVQGAVIQKGAHGHALHQLRHAANVIVMVVRDEDVIDPPQAGTVRRSHNPAAWATVPEGNALN